MQENVQEIKNLISDAYSDVSLLKPWKADYKDEIYHYEVENLVGIRTPFKKADIETSIPMDSNKKYIMHKSNRPIKLLPLFDIIESPEKEHITCYFYNRYNKSTEEARFVSYHLDKEPEIFIPKEKIESAISLLTDDKL